MGAQSSREDQRVKLLETCTAIKTIIEQWNVKLPDELTKLIAGLDQCTAKLNKMREQDYDRVQPQLAEALPGQMENLLKMVKQKSFSTDKPKNLSDNINAKSNKQRFREFATSLDKIIESYEMNGGGPGGAEQKQQQLTSSNISNTAAKSFWEKTYPNKQTEDMWVEFRKKYSQAYPEAKPLEPIHVSLGRPGKVNIQMFNEVIGEYGFPFDYDEKVMQERNEKQANSSTKRTGKVLALQAGLRGADNDIYKAIAANNLEGVDRMLKADPKLVNSQITQNNPNGFTPLHQAVLHANYPIVQRMLQEKIDISKVDIDSRTAIDVAAAEDNLDIVKLLYPVFKTVNFVVAVRALSPKTLNWLKSQTKNALDLMQAKWKGTTALHTAVSRGNKAAVDACLDTGVDVNIQDDAGRSPLHMAVDDVAMISHLLANDDINPDLPDSKGITPLMQTVVTGSTDAIAALVVGGADICGQDAEGKTAMFYLALREGIEKNIVQLLVNAGADVNHRDDKGNTPLHALALAKEGPDASSSVDQLVQLGAEVEAKNSKGQTALTIAALTGKGKTTTALLKEKANPNCKDNNGNTPLHGASKVEIATELIHGGAKTSTINKDGNTPLHTQMQLGNTHVGEVLLGNGAKITKNYMGQTPIQTAVVGGNSNGVQILIEALSERKFTADDQFTSLAQVIDNQDNAGQTAANAAVGKNNASAIQVLATAGADLNIADNKGNTVIHSGMAAGATEALKVALKFGADPNKQNASGDAGLLIGVATGNNEAVKVLLDAPGINTALKNKEGVSATQMAIQHGNTEGINSITTKNLALAGAHDGALCIGLRWEDSNDLDLYVWTPTGALIYFAEKKQDGGELDIDMNLMDERIQIPAVEHTFWREQKTIPSGNFQVAVRNSNYRLDGGHDPCEFSIVISQNKEVKYTLFSKVELGVKNHPKLYNSEFVCTFHYDTATATISKMTPRSNTQLLECTAQVPRRQYSGVQATQVSEAPTCLDEEELFQSVVETMRS